MLCAVYGSARITATAFTTIVFLIAAIMKLIAWPPWANSREKPHSMHDLRFLGRGAALGRSYLALEFPRQPAAMVQMAATDLLPIVESVQRISERLLLRRRARSEFKLVVHLAAPHWDATDRARRACAVAVERAARFGCWQSAAQDRFARFRSEDWLGEHGSPPRMAVPVHAQRMLQTKGTPMGTRAETQSRQGRYNNA